MTSKKSNLSEKIQSFIAHRILNALSLFWLCAAIFILVSLASYQKTDPSWNAHSDSVQNIFGYSGAVTSDFIIQTIGLAGFLVIPVFAIWAFQIFKRNKITFKAGRLVLLIFSCLSTASALAYIQNTGAWLPGATFGGATGILIHNALNKVTALVLSDSYWVLNSLVLAVIASFSFIASSTLNKAQLAFIGKKILQGIKFAITFVMLCYAAFRDWLDQYGSKDQIIPKQSRVQEIKKKRKTQIRKDPPVLSPEPIPSSSIKIEKAKEKSVPQSTGLKQLPLTTPDENYELPSVDLLQEDTQDKSALLDERSLQNNAAMLAQVLADFNIEGKIVKVRPGPVVTLYELEPAPGVKSSRIIGLADDIARSMSAISVRVAVIPGRSVLGIEMPNKNRQIVYLRDTLESKEYIQTKHSLPLILGKKIGGEPVIADLAKMPHLLVAGTTGSGKSVAVNTMLLSLLYRLSPAQCRLILIDPKMLELSVYDDIPHLLTPVVTEPGKAIVALKWLVAEMENRYRAMSKLGVRNIDGYNARIREALKKGEVLNRKVQTGFDPDSGKPVFEDQPLDMTELPFIVVVVDEFADLMLVAGKDVENAIQRLAQMARAAGIHIIMATQRPSVDVITGVIKANFPTRISFQVTSKIDSRTILGDGGAEQLLGMGDMLYMAGGGKLTRVHSPFTSDEEVEQVITHIKSQGEPSYLEDITRGDIDAMADDIFGERSGGGSDVDELYDKAVAVVAREGKASTSFIQRHLQIGYNRAARIMEEMERQGVVTPASSSGKREVLVSDHSDVA